MATVQPRLAKLTRPSTLCLLKRERLFTLLDESRHTRCLWISAPAGSGKTSLLSSWIEVRHRNAAWYGVDAGDADPATLFHYLGLASLAAANRRRVALPHLTPEYQVGIDVFALRFFEIFFASFKPPFSLVFDNCQDVPPHSPFYAILNGAMHALPPGGQCTCLSRETLPAALSRWNADSGFKTVGWDDLRFTDEEAQGLALLDRPQDGECAVHLNALARGWAAGLKILLRAQTAGVDVSEVDGRPPQLLFDYFATQVFDKARPDLRDFLLKTSVLSSFTAEVARQLSGHEEAAQTLAWLLRNRLFIDQRLQQHAEPFYEYHPLIREFLREQARRALGPATFSQLQERGAELLETTGQVDLAASLWRDSRNWPALQRLIGEQAPALLVAGRIATLEEWIQAIPVASLNSAPWLLYWLGTCHGFHDPALARQSLEQAYAQFKASHDNVGAFLSIAGIFTAYFHQWSDMKPLDPWIAEFEKLLDANEGVMPPAIEAHVLGACVAIIFRCPDHRMLPTLVGRATQLMSTVPDAEQRLGVAAFAIQYMNWSGDFVRARALCESVRGADQQNVSVLARLYLALIVSCVMWGDAEHDEAYAVLKDALTLGKESGIHLLDPEFNFQLAYTALSAGDAEVAEQALDASLPLNPYRRMDGYHHAFLRAGALLVRGRLSEAITIARENLQPMIATGSPFGEGAFRSMFGQMLMIDGQHGEARQHLEWVLEFARRMPSDILTFHALMALAYIHFETHQDIEGIGALGKALCLGARHNYMNCHPLWMPKVMARLCARALETGTEVGYVRRLVTKRGLAPPADCFDLEAWPWPMRIYTLGRFAIVINGEALKSPAKAPRKPLELLKALIAQGGRSVCATALAALLWPDLEGDAGLNAFHLALHRLRRLLRGEEALALQDGKLSFDPRSAWVDAWALERLTGQVELAADGDGAGEDSAALGKRLLRLYAGQFLGDEEAPWALPHRERLRSKFVRSVAMLGDRLEKAHCLNEAADLYRRALEQDPLAEEFHRGLMRCLEREGRLAEALDAYRRCRDIISVTLGVPPSVETQALYRTIKG